MRLLVQWLIEWPERVARHLTWLAPLFARITVQPETWVNLRALASRAGATVERFIGVLVAERFPAEHR